MRFKIGDFVTGTRTASKHYKITVEGWTGKVIEVYGDYGEVINLIDASGSFRPTVSAKHFRLASEEEKKRAGFSVEDSNSSEIVYAEIKNVIFNAPATIVFWSDGTKTVVKCGEGEKYDPEKGLALCIAKKALGNNYDYYEPFKKYLGKYRKKESKKASAKGSVASTTDTKK